MLTKQENDDSIVRIIMTEIPIIIMIIAIKTITLMIDLMMRTRMITERIMK